MVGAASTSAATSPATVTPPIVGVSPDFMAYIQMQERIRQEEKVVMERQRKEDVERALQEQHHQQKAYEIQLQLLHDQIAAMAATNGKSSSKMPTFDMAKDKDTFKLWKARWDAHVKGHKIDKIGTWTSR